MRKTDSLFALLVDTGNNFLKRSSLKFRAFSSKLRVHGVARYDVRNSTVPVFERNEQLHLEGMITSSGPHLGIDNMMKAAPSERGLTQKI